MRKFVVFALLLTGCQIEMKRFGSAKEPPSAEKLNWAQINAVQRAACLKPPRHDACEPGFRASFGSAEFSASVWCQDGRPHGWFQTPTETVSGNIGLVVWEAIWRTLDAAESCAFSYGSPIRITRPGKDPTSCAHSRLDIRRLFEIGQLLVKGVRPNEIEFAGLPGSPPPKERGICEIDPSACPKMCPKFEGDPWAGQEH